MILILNQLVNVIQIEYSGAMLAAKVSILIQLKKIFCPGQIRNSVFWIIFILNTVTIAYYISHFFVFIFLCWPREAIWNHTDTVVGRCIDYEAAMLVTGIVNLLLDVGMSMTPIWAIWHLQLPTKRKLEVSAVFGLGIM